MKIRNKKKEIPEMRFTFLISRKIDEILESQELNSEEQVALIKYYMDKWRERTASETKRKVK